MADQSTVSRPIKEPSSALASPQLPAPRPSFLLEAHRKQRRPIEDISDAPDHVWRRGTSRYDAGHLGNTVTIGQAARRAL